MFQIHNRRYTGSKAKLMPWIKELILEHCPEHNSFFDVFGGTGVVSAFMTDTVRRVVINDLLFSNKIIYEAFFSSAKYSKRKINDFLIKYSDINRKTIAENYVSQNFGDKYFEYSDAKLIGLIRENIQKSWVEKKINHREYSILLASLLYSFDRCANTVGHYEAYIKNKGIRSSFCYELIQPLDTNVSFEFYREDANKLCRNISADLAFLDPPYNSRQYSRFYHVMETITKWDKPSLSGSAMKPPEENMSEYCRTSAPQAFADLVENLNVKNIVVTYNNTYDSKSSSSRNKITLEQIRETLERKGRTQVFEKSYRRFNAGKTTTSNHKELVFITRVGD